MNFTENIANRYTTKLYDASKKVDADIIEQLKQVLYLSPSSLNTQPWNFTFIEEGEKKQALAHHSFHNTEKVQKASHIVAFNVIDDLEYFEQKIEETLPEYAVQYYQNNLKGQPAEEIKSWMSKQVYIALGVFLSACANMGIDSTPMEGIEPEKYTEILGLDKHKTILAVAIGYRDEEDLNQLSKKPKQRRGFDEIISTTR